MQSESMSLEVKPKSCIMCDGIYLRFRGQLPCWDHVGETHVLRTVTTEGLRSGRETNLFAYPELLHIRRSFASGEYPWPEDCSRCALLGHVGSADELEPSEVRVLHVEPSYYCHLSCPQCIPARDRRKLEEEPHNLDPELFRAFLERLREDGVTTVRYVYFEGRGDPLVNPHLGRMIADTKEIFPRALTTVVTHGNYPFKSWMVDCGLDILKLSVDGAWQASYETYRVDGKLETVFELARRLVEESRDGKSSLRVIWRYILFEWNDSDEELLEAWRKARELDIELRFMRTHSEGRSLRFPDSQILAAGLDRLGITAGEDATFEIKSAEGREGQGGDVIGEQVVFLYEDAQRAWRNGDPATTLRQVRAALGWDPGIDDHRTHDAARDLVLANLDEVLSDARSPATLSWLAAFCREWGDDREAGRLIERYLEIAPRASDRSAILAERHLLAAIEFMESGDRIAAAGEVCEALSLDPGIAVPPADRTDVGIIVRSHLDHLLAAQCAPSTLGALAHLCDWNLGDKKGAEKLYRRYLELAPEAANRELVERRLGRLSGLGRIIDVVASLKRGLTGKN